MLELNPELLFYLGNTCVSSRWKKDMKVKLFKWKQQLNWKSIHILITWRTINNFCVNNAKFKKCKWMHFCFCTIYLILIIFWTRAFRWKGVLWLQYVIMSLGKCIFSRVAYKIFLKLHMKLGGLNSKNWWSLIFGKKSHFGDNAEKHPQNRVFGILQKKVYWCVDL